MPLRSLWHHCNDQGPFHKGLIIVKILSVLISFLMLQLGQNFAHVEEIDWVITGCSAHGNWLITKRALKMCITGHLCGESTSDKVQGMQKSYDVSKVNDHTISSADSRLASSQWEMSLQSKAISHWLGANLESASYKETSLYFQMSWISWQLSMHSLVSLT